MSLADLARQTLLTIMDACARDPELRSRVMADPKAALTEEGMDLPFDKVEAVEDTPETTHVVLTDPNAELSDEQMEMIVGGTGWWGAMMERRRQFNAMVAAHDSISHDWSRGA